MRRTYSHIDLDERRKIARWRMADLIEICNRLNATPRKCLGYRTPAEVFRKKLLAQMRHAG